MRKPCGRSTRQLLQRLVCKHACATPGTARIAAGLRASAPGHYSALPTCPSVPACKPLGPSASRQARFTPLEPTCHSTTRLVGMEPALVVVLALKAGASLPQPHIDALSAHPAVPRESPPVMPRKLCAPGQLRRSASTPPQSPSCLCSTQRRRCQGPTHEEAPRLPWPRMCSARSSCGKTASSGLRGPKGGGRTPEVQMDTAGPPKTAEPASQQAVQQSQRRALPQRLAGPVRRTRKVRAAGSELTTSACTTRGTARACVGAFS